MERLMTHSTQDGSGPNSPVNDIKVLPDGKILIVGTFTGYNGGQTRRGIARLNADGTLDNSFTIGTGVNLFNPIWSVDIQSDGKVIIGGEFTSFNGIPRARIARLNTDGSVDESFNLNPGPNASVGQVIVQPDDKIIVRGNFISFNYINTNNDTIPVYKVFRLNSDGSLDEDFTVTVSLSDYFSKMYLQNDGKILLARFNGTVVPPVDLFLRRLNPDGSIDQEIGAGIEINERIHGIVQDEESILITGAFTTVDNHVRLGIARLFGDEDETLHMLNLIANPTPGGSVLGAGEYSPGTNIEISAESNPGWVFVNWTQNENIISTTPDFTYTMPDAPVVLLANFDYLNSIENDLNSNGITVYPNPATDQLWIEFMNPLNSRVNIQLLTLQGQIVYETEINNSGNTRTAVETDGLKQGIYLLKVNGSEINTTRKVIIQK
jgi:uncharacterized delta-60 repeat protein